MCHNEIRRRFPLPRSAVESLSFSSSTSSSSSSSELSSSSSAVEYLLLSKDVFCALAAFKLELPVRFLLPANCDRDSLSNLTQFAPPLSAAVEAVVGDPDGEGGGFDVGVVGFGSAVPLGLISPVSGSCVAGNISGVGSACVA